jgi:hypothetical protein
LSDALGTATEERHQRNLSGRRFSAWLSHTTSSHQETARPLLTPGEILQLPREDSLVFLSQIQALDRTQPGLPLKKGRGPTLTHDYKRHGTTTLFAALNVLTGEVTGRNMARHRNQEFIRFLNLIERDVPAGKVIHVILDNYAVHKHAKVRAWLERHPRWTFHFIPTSSSWLNAVEGFFAKLTRRRLKHGVFHSVIDLQAAINRFIAEHNGGEAKPFTWRADPDAIINARNRGFQMLDSIH